MTKHLRPARLTATFLLLAGLPLLGACSRPTPASAPGDEVGGGDSAATEALPPPMAPSEGDVAPPTPEGYPDQAPTEAPTAYPDQAEATTSAP